MFLEEEGGVEKCRNQRKWFRRTRTVFHSINQSINWQGRISIDLKVGRETDLRHESMNTGSVSFTMGKCRRLPM